MKLCAVFKPILGLAALFAIAGADFTPRRTGVQIGVVEVNEKGEEQSFTPSPDIPNVPGTIFGWDLAIESIEPELKVTLMRELTMPGPTNWGAPDPSVKISPDRKTWRTTSEVTFEGGRFFEAMEVSPGDPSGRATITFAINDKSVGPIAMTFMSPERGKPK